MPTRKVSTMNKMKLALRTERFNLSHRRACRRMDIVISAQTVEGHDMGCLGCKRAGQGTLKSIIRRIVRPERENTSWIKMTSKPSQPFRLVQRGVAWMQQLARRMIDIHQHGIETAAL